MIGRGIILSVGQRRDISEAMVAFVVIVDRTRYFGTLWFVTHRSRRLTSASSRHAFVQYQRP
jgi:hypothetical protein